jgi:hypothetical protein
MIPRMMMWRPTALPGLLCLPALLCLSAAPARADCVPEKAPTTAVTVNQPPVTEDNVLGMKELNRRKGVSSKSEHVFGLTESRFEVRWAFQAEALPLKGGSYCARFTDISVTLDLEIAVHMAKEMNRDTCFYGAALKHEHGHVAIEQDAVAKMRAAAEAVLHRLALATATEPTDRAAQKALETTLNAALNGALEPISKDREKRQDAMDTETEYRAVVASCAKTGDNG